MKIVFVINSVEVGGAEQMLLKLLGSACLEEDHKTVVVLADKGTLHDRFEALADELVYLGMSSIGGAIPAVWRLTSLLKAVQPDVVHSWLYKSDVLASIACLFSGKGKLVWSIRQTSLAFRHNHIGTLGLVVFCALMSRVVPRLIISNSSQAVESHVRAGYGRHRIEVIPNGFDPSYFRPDTEARKRIRSQLGYEGHTIVIGHFGRFDPQKGHKAMIAAMALVGEVHPQAELLLCGRGVDGENNRLTDQISKLNLGDKVALLGQRKDIPDLLNAVDLFVSSSSGEGFPNALGEAMLCEKICVATDVGDCAKIVGSYGFIVQPDDEFQLKDGILEAITLLDDDERNVGRLARKHIKRHYTIEPIADSFRQSYAAIIDGDIKKG